jgi:hypothetical protein
MNGPRHNRRTDTQRPWQPRFGLGGLLLVTLIFCVLAAGGFYLAQSLQSGGVTGYLLFVLFITAGPALLLVAVSLFRQAVEWLNRR